MRNRALISVLAVPMLLSLVACANAPPAQPAAAAAKPTIGGHLMIVGGGPIPPEIIKRFVDLAGGPGKARIVCFPMSSSDPDAGIEMTADLVKLGAKAERIVFDHAQADTEEAAKRLDGVTGIWFGGGDQVLLTKALGGTRVEAAMHKLLAGGAVLGGTSAGAAVMTTPMLTGEEKKVGGVRPPADLKSPLAAYMTVARDDVETVTGFGFLPGAIVDQHFIRRRRSNRLLSVVLEHPQLVGVGIDESTAVEVGPDGKWKILGESAAMIFDARKARITPVGAPALGAAGVSLLVLPAGSTYDPATGEATLGGSPAR
ncbi:MAG: cyanophycinase [Acidobacteriota bacterium]